VHHLEGALELQISEFFRLQHLNCLPHGGVCEAEEVGEYDSNCLAR
jgi:hypothetical protein